MSATPVWRDRVEQGFGQRLAAALERGEPGEVLVPVDADAGGFEDALDGRHLIEAEPAALHQRDANGHDSFLLDSLSLHGSRAERQGANSRGVVFPRRFG